MGGLFSLSPAQLRFKSFVEGSRKVCIDEFYDGDHPYRSCFELRLIKKDTDLCHECSRVQNVYDVWVEERKQELFADENIRFVLAMVGDTTPSHAHPADEEPWAG